MRLLAVHAAEWTLPLRAPFAISQRVAHAAHNVRVTVLTDDPAVVGFGACAPVQYVTGETPATVLDALGAVAAEFEGVDAGRLRPLWERAARLLPDAPSARASLEMALCDAWAKGWRLPCWQHFGGARNVLTTDLTIPLVTPDEAAALAQAAWEDGFRCLKMKVGHAEGHESDLARMEAVLKAVPGVTLRVDANQAFAPDAAVQFARSLAEMNAPVELLEQPVPQSDLVGLKYVRDHCPYPVFADECAQDVPGVVRLLQADAVDGVNVKLMKSGLAGALEIISLCRAFGKKLMLGCMLESSLGIAAAAQIAGGTGAFDYLDLDSHRLLCPVDGLTGGYACAGETLRVGDDGPGWGVTLAAEA